MASKVKKEEGDEQEGKFQLSKNRFVSVSEFKGKLRVDIREYYLNDDGEKKPGKKGISLSPEEWLKFTDLIPSINKAMGVIEEESASSGSGEDTNDS